MITCIFFCSFYLILLFNKRIFHVINFGKYGDRSFILVIAIFHFYLDGRRILSHNKSFLLNFNVLPFLQYNIIRVFKIVK